jgi:mutator protein MutT
MAQKLKQATLLFLIEDDNILLAMKKRGFGAGHWNGVGGKPDAGESIDQTAIRECREEIQVTPLEIKHVATLDFHFPKDKSDWDQQVIVYTCSKWDGEPVETEEMKPAWFKISDIPYEKMWKDDKYWLPKVLESSFVKASFTFDGDNNVIDYLIQ